MSNSSVCNFRGTVMTPVVTFTGPLMAVAANLGDISEVYAQRTSSINHARPLLDYNTKAIDLVNSFCGIQGLCQIQTTIYYVGRFRISPKEAPASEPRFHIDGFHNATEGNLCISSRFPRGSPLLEYQPGFATNLQYGLVASPFPALAFTVWSRTTFGEVCKDASIYLTFKTLYEDDLNIKSFFFTKVISVNVRGRFQSKIMDFLIVPDLSLLFPQQLSCRERLERRPEPLPM